MKAALSALGALVFLNAVLSLGTATGTPYAGRLTLRLIQFLVLGLVAVLIGRALAAYLSKRAQLGKIRPVSEPKRRLWVVVLFTLLAQVMVMFAFAPVGFLAVETAYYTVLFLAGVALAVWSGTGSAAPVWVGTGLLFVPSVINAAAFASDAGNRWQYGPEVYLFMFWDYVGRMSMLPLDAAVTWSGWAIGAARWGPTARP